MLSPFQNLNNDILLPYTSLLPSFFTSTFTIPWKHVSSSSSFFPPPPASNFNFWDIFPIYVLPLSLSQNVSTSSYSSLYPFICYSSQCWISIGVALFPILHYSFPL